MQRAMIAATLAAAAITTKAHDQTIEVPGDHATIQAAIDHAVTGDEIVVAAGVYGEQIDLLGKAITLRSASGANATIIDGTGLGGSVIVCDDFETPATRIRGFTVRGGVGTPYLGETVGGGLFVLQSSPTIQNCIVEGNMADSGGGISVFAGAPTIERCVFRDNVAGGGAGGGGLAANVANLHAINCIFENNAASAFGGGINTLGGAPKFTNCLVIGNEAAMGGGIRNSGSSPVISNCTITDNEAAMGGGMRSSSGGAPSILNSIVWGNTPTAVVDLAGAETTIASSTIEGGWNGDGNQSGDPVLVDGYRLDLTSPCIDAGENAYVPNGIETDLDGRDRIANGIVDMGVVEPAVCGADLSSDGEVTLADLLILLAAWEHCGDPCPADLDGDGAVALPDLLLLLMAWGPC